MKKDFKYIIKRILIGVGIILVMSFINSCQVHAETISVSLKSFSTTSSYYNKYSYFAIPNSYTMYVQVQDDRQYSTMANDGFNHLLIKSCTNRKPDFDRNAFTNGKATSSYGSVSDDGFTTFFTTQPCSFSLGNVNYNGYILYSYFYLNSSDLYTTNTANYYMNRFTFPLLNHAYGDIGIMGMSATLSTEYPQALEEAISNQTNVDIENAIKNQTQQEYDAANRAHQDSQAINDSINDSSIPSDSSSKINNITSAITNNQNSSIVQIATFFPQTLQLILNGFNTSCTGGYSLGSLYGTELSIPCINPVDYLGSFLWGVIDSILCLCYLIPLCKFLVNKYNDLTSMKNLRWQ